jgi:hypothetical protein
VRAREVLQRAAAQRGDAVLRAEAQHAVDGVEVGRGGVGGEESVWEGEGQR